MGTLHPLIRKNRQNTSRHLRIVRSHELQENFQTDTDKSASGSHVVQLKRGCEQTKQVVLFLGHAMPQGIPVALQLGNEGEWPGISMTGWLPPIDGLITAYEQWQQTYQQIFSCSVGLNDGYYKTRLSVPAVQVTNVSYREILQSCCCAEKVLARAVNQWFNSALFRPVKETLLAYCHPQDTIRLVLQTDDLQIQKLPLHLWDWFDRYAQAELVLGSASYRRSPHIDCASSSLRVLAVLGDSYNLDTNYDLAMLEALPNAVVTDRKSVV